jgi:alpha-glucuronidase
MKRIGNGKIAVIVFSIFALSFSALAETGYSLWLRYVAITDGTLLSQYRSSATQIVVQGTDSTHLALRNELKRGFDSLLNQTTPTSTSVTLDGAVVAGTPTSSSIINGLGLTLDANTEAYRIITMTVSGHSAIVIASRGSVGVLYGAFHLLRLIQTNKAITALDVSEKPKIKRRLLNHWANLDGSMERGYGGNSIWQWSTLPGTLGSRYTDYARACASIGINGTVLNNVNNTSNMNILSAAYITKIKALAGVFRPYGIRVYLCAYFNAPTSITTSTKGTCSNYDPLDANVIAWWASLANDIYAAIPDFGGFLVKAGAEGQPGPGTYGRTHAQGANCIAAALAPHGGVCIWRTFVYSNSIDTDRMKRAYMEFRPLDSVNAFSKNVILQNKNGPYDFQPREPVHPLFGGLHNTHVGMEFQITLEYLGQGIQLVYMGPYWKEVLDFDTYENGAGSTVAKVLDGTRNGDTETCISGVSNVGDNTNWCGHHFHQANWFAYGRLAWNHTLSSDSIADDWARMTWGNNPTVVNTVTAMMRGSREACVNYMTPLGLCGLFCMGTSYGSDHYGPCPGQNDYPSQPDWNAVYWHKADAAGVGYDRTTATGSNFTSQYYTTNRTMYNSLANTPDNLLAAFHHVSWSYVIPSTGRTFWNEMCYRYCLGCQYVHNLRTQWSSLNGLVDAARYNDVSSKLATHETDANTWRTVCTSYFQGFSGMAIPSCNTEVLTPQVNSKRAIVLTKGQTLKVFDMRGRLVATLTAERTIPAADFGALTGKMLRPGVYIVKQTAAVPFKVAVGLSR